MVEGGMEISAPVVLARLPKPLTHNGKTRFGPVWGFRDGTKRKRQEICSTVDGHSVNVYSAQSGQVIASHAVPPHAIFPTAPVSFRWIEGGKVLRQTVFAVQDETLRLCSVIHEGAETGQRMSESSIELKNSTSTLIHLDVVATEQQKILVAVQEDGSVNTASSDLQHVSTNKLGGGSDSGTPTLLAACCLSLHEASKSVLKSRNDIVKALPENSIIIPAFGLQESPNYKRPTYSVWCLPSNHQVTSGSPSSTPAELLFQHDLSSPNLPLIRKTQETKIGFVSRASILDIKTPRHYVRYKLGGPVPTRLPASSPAFANLFDMITLSSEHALIAYQMSLQIVDGQYGVAQATLDVKLSKKRKQPGANAPTGAIELISHFSQAQRVLARIGSNLIAFDVKEPRGKQSRTSRLAHNVGRGQRESPTPKVKPMSLSFTDAPNDLAPDWSKSREDLQQMVNENDISGFERTILKQLAPKFKENGRRGLDGEWEHNIHPDLDATVDFVLTKVFSIVTETQPGTSPSSTGLRVNLVAPRLVEWLSSAGLLCVWRLRKAFGSHIEQHILDRLRPGHITQALYDADTSSDFLLMHLKYVSNLPVEEQVGALKILINLAKAESELDGQQNDQLQSQSSALVHVMGRPESSEEIRIDSTSLPPALVRAIVLVMNQLGVIDQNVLSTHLRDTLSPEEITTSIQFLRQQLFQGGHASWLTPNTANAGQASAAADTEETIETSTHLTSFESILKMLSACLDTIGPFQLLNSGKADQMVENIIPELLSEVELSAQYIEKSAELQGILRETIRYSKSRESKMRRDTGRMPEPGKTGHAVGEIFTVYSEHSDDEATSSLAGMLPLSLRDEDFVDPVRIRKGSGQVSERSKREMLMLKGRQKGAYSFERLIL